ncbi:MAG: D-alanine--D-alanine ligase [Candidatus Colwellbacteria bacterium]|nr:D-alanine--D-alanine ligase [Candidatus Colwellbacteria bacterium]
MKRLRVAILVGGPSAEHDVSLETGSQVLEYLDQEKYEAFPLFISRGGKWEMPPENLRIFADLAFIAMHGEYGEDGTVQDILEQEGIPYTGSGVLASALGMNKIFTHRIFRTHGLHTPEFLVVNENDNINPEDFDFSSPLVVKPADRGSSVGVTIVRQAIDLEEALRKAHVLSRDALVEKYVPGQELTVSVVEDEDGELNALMPLEIIPKMSKFFDYQSKYTTGGADEIIPRLPEYKINFLKEIAKVTHRAIGASGMSRTDMILSPDDKVYVLEINTIPGMTKNSSLPKAAELSGLSFSQVLDKIISRAYKKNAL